MALDKYIGEEEDSMDNLCFEMDLGDPMKLSVIEIGDLTDPDHAREVMPMLFSVNDPYVLLGQLDWASSFWGKEMSAEYIKWRNLFVAIDGGIINEIDSLLKSSCREKGLLNGRLITLDSTLDFFISKEMFVESGCSPDWVDEVCVVSFRERSVKLLDSALNKGEYQHLKAKLVRDNKGSSLLDYFEESEDDPFIDLQLYQDIAHHVIDRLESHTDFDSLSDQLILMKENFIIKGRHVYPELKLIFDYYETLLAKYELTDESKFMKDTLSPIKKADALKEELAKMRDRFMKDGKLIYSELKWMFEVYEAKLLLLEEKEELELKELRIQLKSLKGRLNRGAETLVPVETFTELPLGCLDDEVVNMEPIVPSKEYISELGHELINVELEYIPEEEDKVIDVELEYIPEEEDKVIDVKPAVSPEIPVAPIESYGLKNVIDLGRAVLKGRVVELYKDLEECLSGRDYIGARSKLNEIKLMLKNSSIKDFDGRIKNDEKIINGLIHQEKDSKFSPYIMHITLGIAAAVVAVIGVVGLMNAADSDTDVKVAGIVSLDTPDDDSFEEERPTSSESEHKVAVVDIQVDKAPVVEKQNDENVITVMSYVNSQLEKDVRVAQKEAKKIFKSETVKIRGNDYIFALAKAYDLTSADLVLLYLAADDLSEVKASKGANQYQRFVNYLSSIEGNNLTRAGDMTIPAGIVKSIKKLKSDGTLTNSLGITRLQVEKNQRIKNSKKRTVKSPKAVSSSARSQKTGVKKKKGLFSRMTSGVASLWNGRTVELSDKA